jgi:hypothetical protein
MRYPYKMKCDTHYEATLPRSDFEDLVCVAYIAQDPLRWGQSIGLRWLEVARYGMRVVRQEVCITIPDTHGACLTNRTNLHPRWLQRTLEMRTICAVFYVQFKGSLNSIGFECLGDKLIVTTADTWTHKKGPHAASATRKNFSHGTCLRTLATFSRKGKINCIFGKTMGPCGGSTKP